MKDILIQNWKYLYLALSYLTTAPLVWFIFGKIKKEPAAGMAITVLRATFSQNRKKLLSLQSVVPAAIIAFVLIPVVWPLILITATKYFFKSICKKPAPKPATNQQQPANEANDLEFDPE